MTTHYIEVTLLPDPEFSHSHLLSALVAKLHRVLINRRIKDIGTSYPGHVNKPLGKRTLGSRLRLHGSLTALEGLMEEDWLKGMRDHTQVSDVLQVPADAQYRIVRRKQFKTSVDRMRRRRMRRKSETVEQAIVAIPESVERQPDLPFVQMKSGSTSQNFNLYIEHGPLQSHPLNGSFNAYGLSCDATVPWF